MTRPVTCRTVRSSLSEAAEPGAGPTYVAHLEACADCAALVARQRRLVGWLERLPQAPAVDVAMPRLPEPREGRLLPWRVPAWAAGAAAAALLVGFVWRSAASDSHPVRIQRVVDVADAPPQDERLLALTGGIEAVAMRRPTEIR